MTSTSPGARTDGQPPAGQPARAPGLAPQTKQGVAGRVAAAARLLVLAPVRRRAWADLRYWLAASVTSLLGFAVLAVILLPGLVLSASLIGALAGLALLALAVTAGRASGAWLRRIADKRLGAAVPPPAPFQKGKGFLGRLDARLRDVAGWRGALYLLLRLPLTFASVYGVVAVWAAGLFWVTYPAWWLILNGPGARGKAPITHPFPAGGAHVTSFAGSLLICLAGVTALLIAPWTTRLAIVTDQWLVQGLLSNRGRTERIRELEASRASAVDDSAATLRRVERDLHDGAQARLVALAMHLGRARDQLGAAGEPRDVGRARELMAAAQQDATVALTELRDLARGIHPPALDAGLADALAGLTAASGTPASLTADIPVRPTPAIETIAYFCVAELLTNVSKHSRAARADVRVTQQVTQRERTLVLTVSDDGDGGAAARPGGGLAGLVQRVRTVDGTLAVHSPLGGPTVVTIELPMQA